MTTDTIAMGHHSRDMEKDSRFWDRVAEKYSRQPIADEAAYERKLEATRQYFTPDTEVLELGCGTGSTALLHAPHVKHIRATDISARMLEIARRKAAEQKIDNVTFEQSRVEDIRVADGSVDVVMAMSLLHLLKDRDAAIARVRRMLKPGGVFVTSTVCLADSMSIFRFIGPIGMFLGIFPLIRVITRGQLLDSLTAGGFKIDYDWRPKKNGAAVFVIARKPK